MEKIINKYLNELSFGYVISTYNKGSINNYVFGNLENFPNQIKMTYDTLFDIASLTKIFTSVLIYNAYEEGIISLNSTIYEINPNFKNLKEVTILDLLSHRIEIWTDGLLKTAKTKKEVMNRIYNSYVKSKKRVYCDSHYIILSFLLEELYEISFQDLIQIKIFNYLGLKSATFNPNIKKNIASTNYENINGTIKDYVLKGIVHDDKARVGRIFNKYLGHAGIFINTDDFMKFMSSVFIKYKMLKKETIQLMLSHDAYYENNYDLFKTYNYMGTRFKNLVKELNDVPYAASDMSFVFTGYTGPILFVDYKKKIIIIVMSNSVHLTKFSREQRYKKEVDLLNSIYDKINK